MAHYKQALDLDPEDEDARFNLEFVREEIKRRLNEAREREKKEQEKKEEGQTCQQPQPQQGESQQGEKQQEESQGDRQETAQQPEPPQQESPRQPEQGAGATGFGRRPAAAGRGSPRDEPRGSGALVEHTRRRTEGNGKEAGPEGPGRTSPASRTRTGSHVWLDPTRKRLEDPARNEAGESFIFGIRLLLALAWVGCSRRRGGSGVRGLRGSRLGGQDRGHPRGPDLPHRIRLRTETASERPDPASLCRTSPSPKAEALRRPRS